ncbi:hypothetical protein V2J09_015544 [Rumex salicifolius]
MADDDEEAPGHHLPRELLFDIFSRCPPKSLYRLRCVCSKWLSLLTADPDFISLYHRHHRLGPLVLFSSRAASTTTGADGVLVSSSLRIDNGLLRFKFAIGFAGELKSRRARILRNQSRIQAHPPLHVREIRQSSLFQGEGARLRGPHCAEQSNRFDSSSNSTEFGFSEFVNLVLIGQFVPPAELPRSSANSRRRRAAQLSPEAAE